MRFRGSRLRSIVKGDFGFLIGSKVVSRYPAKLAAVDLEFLDDDDSLFF